MEFILDRILPVLGTTVAGFAIVILLIAFILIINTLVRIKDYKEIKSNTAELIGDARRMFSGRSNRKKRIVLLSMSAVVVVLALIVSAIILDAQKEKQLVITSPTEKISQDIWEEMLLAWQPVPGTGEYYVNIYPVDKRIYDSIAMNSFYVDGDKSGVRFTLGNLVFGTGKYEISVSSDVPDVRSGSVFIYLVDKQNKSTSQQDSSTPEPMVSTMP